MTGNPSITFGNESILRERFCYLTQMSIRLAVPDNVCKRLIGNSYNLSRNLPYYGISEIIQVAEISSVRRGALRCVPTLAEAEEIVENRWAFLPLYYAQQIFKIR